jgi:hypothetical protein
MRDLATITAFIVAAIAAADIVLGHVVGILEKTMTLAADIKKNSRV